MNKKRKIKMGALKYYSPYVSQSIKIKLKLEKKGKLLDSANEKLEIFNSYDLYKINVNKKKVKIFSTKNFSEIKDKEHEGGEYQLILYIRGKIIKNISHLFENSQNIIEIDLSNFNPYFINDMSCLFKDCTKLQKIIPKNYFETLKSSSEVNRKSMFEGCDKFDNCDKLEHSKVESSEPNLIISRFRSSGNSNQ